MLAQYMPNSVSIVGAGRVGRALGRQLHALRWRIQAVTALTITSAREAVRAIGAGIPSEHLNLSILDATNIFITTPDDAIQSVAEELAHLGGKDWNRKIVFHMSGAKDSSILQSLADLGAATGSMHPLQTFSDQRNTEMTGCIFGIEGSPAALKTARKMIRQMGGLAVRLSGANRAAYHVAGTFVCASVLALEESATRILMEQGFTRRQATRALLALTRRTLDNFEWSGPRAAWTGALARRDFSTIRAHVGALAKFPPEYLEVYKAVTRLAASVLSSEPEELLKRLNTEIARGEKRNRQAPHTKDAPSINPINRTPQEENCQG